jgi:hypothetical protein
LFAGNVWATHEATGCRFTFARGIWRHTLFERVGSVSIPQKTLGRVARAGGAGKNHMPAVAHIISQRIDSIV